MFKNIQYLEDTHVKLGLLIRTVLVVLCIQQGKQKQLGLKMEETS